jgi:hypothetical protein
MVEIRRDVPSTADGLDRLVRALARLIGSVA